MCQVESNRFGGVPMRRILSVVAVAAFLMSSASAQAPNSSRDYLKTTASRMVLSTAQFGANMVGRTLESALKRSRDTARADSKPIPADIMEALVPFYPAELLKDVRYSIGDTSPAGVAGFAIRNGNAAAVTLIDTVVFKDEDYIRNLALWAHEIHHVQQYEDWGVSEFAQRYAFDWQGVEAEAQARAKSFVAWYKERTGQN
jgi:hypothetical protein